MRKAQVDDIGHRVEHRRRGGGAGLRAQRVNRRRRPAAFVARANRLIERGALAAAVWLLGSYRWEAVLASCRVELTLGLVALRALEMRARRARHGPLERDLVSGVVGIGLHGGR